jgi:hypothetical protein
MIAPIVTDERVYDIDTLGYYYFTSNQCKLSECNLRNSVQPHKHFTLSHYVRAHIE